MMNQKIVESISTGILRLNETKEKYQNVYEKNLEKKETFEITQMLSNEESKIKMKNLNNKVSSVETRMQYIDFIIEQLNLIKDAIEIEEKGDFNNHCLYFGSGNLYYSKNFLELSENEIFETILNNIIHYSGSLYVINNKDIRLSYILTAFGICYGDNINFKEGKNIYKKYSKEYNYKIIDINKNYRNFVINNNKLLGFFKKGYFNTLTTISHKNIYMTYRIILGNNIKLQNMLIKIEDNNLSLSEHNVEYYVDENDNKVEFKLA